jgi:hypothetical protein
MLRQILMLLLVLSACETFDKVTCHLAWSLGTLRNRTICNDMKEVSHGI